MLTRRRSGPDRCNAQGSPGTRAVWTFPTTLLGSLSGVAKAILESDRAHAQRVGAPFGFQTSPRGTDMNRRMRFLAVAIFVVTTVCAGSGSAREEAGTLFSALPVRF